MKKPKPGQVIVVRWTDCWTHDSWEAISDLLQRRDPVVETFGVFAGVSVSGSWVITSGLLSDDDKGLNHGAGTWYIPAGMVSDWEWLG